MGTQYNAFTRAAVLPFPKQIHPFVIFTVQTLCPSKSTRSWRGRSKRSWGIRVSDGGDSYLDMWKKAVERERKAVEFQKVAENSAGSNEEEEGGERKDVLERKSSEFQKILKVSTEERDRIQRMQVVDRAAAAIAAARAILKESYSEGGDTGASLVSANLRLEDDSEIGALLEGTQNRGTSILQSGNDGTITPGPNFWSWTPPEDNDRISADEGDVESARKSSPSQTKPVMELERNVDILSLPFESVLENDHNPPLPPLQSLMEVEEVEISLSTPETPHLEEERELGVVFSAHAAEAANALNKVDDLSSQGIYPDGSRWWKETGTEVKPDGVVCRWTLTRGVSADKAVEWEEKYWEAADDFDYKELGSEKSGRDSAGNVWREFWKESMYQKDGFVHLEKTADKWGKNGEGNEWQEKWWESYGASGQAEKLAHKWCSIDPNTPLEAGHAHVWHERWGEQYDGQGGSIKYTDKWAERSEGDGWTKWGDKWDEHFDPNGHGVKQGETWWEGKYGERWNRTWGEGHNGSGWVHKYGKSSSGEHWDTHEEQETWYERYPHYGFYHCFENSVQLREVKKPSG